jgi:hypothetical protein
LSIFVIAATDNPAQFQQMGGEQHFRPRSATTGGKSAPVHDNAAKNRMQEMVDKQPFTSSSSKNAHGTRMMVPHANEDDSREMKKLGVEASGGDASVTSVSDILNIFEQDAAERLFENRSGQPFKSPVEESLLNRLIKKPSLALASNTSIASIDGVSADMSIDITSAEVIDGPLQDIGRSSSTEQIDGASGDLSDQSDDSDDAEMALGRSSIFPPQFRETRIPQDFWAFEYHDAFPPDETGKHDIFQHQDTKKYVKVVFPARYPDDREQTEFLQQYLTSAEAALGPDAQKIFPFARLLRKSFHPKEVEGAALPSLSAVWASVHTYVSVVHEGLRQVCTSHQELAVVLVSALDKLTQCLDMLPSLYSCESMSLSEEVTRLRSELEAQSKSYFTSMWEKEEIEDLNSTFHSSLQDELKRLRTEHEHMQSEMYGLYKQRLDYRREMESWRISRAELDARSNVLSRKLDRCRLANDRLKRRLVSAVEARSTQEQELFVVRDEVTALNIQLTSLKKEQATGHRPVAKRDKSQQIDEMDLETVEVPAILWSRLNWMDVAGAGAGGKGDNSVSVSDKSGDNALSSEIELPSFNFELECPFITAILGKRNKDQIVQRPRPPALTPPVLTNIILNIYMEKISADRLDDRDKRPRQTLGMFTYGLALFRWGSQEEAEAFGWELVFNISALRRQSPFVHAFGLFLEGKPPLNALNTYLQAVLSIRAPPTGPWYPVSEADSACSCSPGFIDYTKSVSVILGLFRVDGAKKIKELVSAVKSAAIPVTMEEASAKFGAHPPEGLLKIEMGTLLMLVLNELQDVETRICGRIRKVWMRKAPKRPKAGKPKDALHFTAFREVMEEVAPLHPLPDVKRLYISLCTRHPHPTLSGFLALLMEEHLSVMQVPCTLLPLEKDLGSSMEEKVEFWKGMEEIYGDILPLLERNLADVSAHGPWGDISLCHAATDDMQTLATQMSEKVCEDGTMQQLLAALLSIWTSRVALLPSLPDKLHCCQSLTKSLSKGLTTLLDTAPLPDSAVKAAAEEIQSS